MRTITVEPGARAEILSSSIAESNVNRRTPTE